MREMFASLFGSIFGRKPRLEPVPLPSVISKEDPNFGPVPLPTVIPKEDPYFKPVPLPRVIDNTNY